MYCLSWKDNVQQSKSFLEDWRLQFLPVQVGQRYVMVDEIEACEDMRSRYVISGEINDCEATFHRQIQYVFRQIA